MIQLDKPVLTQEMVDAAVDALNNEPMLFGESVARFEEEFARFCGTTHAIAVGSGTDALIFTLMAAGVRKKRVLTTPCSFVATANAAFHAGGEPVFCDIDPATHNIDPKRIAAALKRDGKAAAVVPVHLHGYPCAMDEIMEAAEKKGAFVLEDACQAHGAFHRGRRAGAIGHAGAFSFNPMKNMTVGGGGGMVTTNDDRIARMVRTLADTGRETPYTHEHVEIGFTSRINTVNAAIGRVQLRHLDEWNGKRRAVAREYVRRLAGLPGLGMPPGGDGNIVPVYNKFAVSCERRDGLRDHLYDNGAESDSHYPIPIHLQPPYRKLGYRKGDFKNAERFADTTLSLPLSVEMQKEEIERVCAAVAAFSAR